MMVSAFTKSEWSNMKDLRNITGYTTGVFDMFHIGHLNILRRSKEHCEHLIVGVTTDDAVMRAKGRMPIVPYQERAEIVRNIRCVDEVFEEDDVDKLIAWNKLRFDIIFKGSDWKGTDKWNALEREFDKRGVTVHYFPYTEHTSSTKLRAVLDQCMSDGASTGR